MNPLNLLMDNYPQVELEQGYKIYPLQFTAEQARYLSSTNNVMNESSSNHPSIIILEQNILVSILRRNFSCTYILSDLELKDALDSALSDAGYVYTSNHPINPFSRQEDQDVLLYKIKW